MATRRRKPAPRKATKRAKPTARKPAKKTQARATKKRAAPKAARKKSAPAKKPARRRVATKAIVANPVPERVEPAAAKESPLDDEMLTDVDYFVARAMRLLFEGKREDDAAAIVEAIRRYVDDVRDGRRELEPDLALTLSCLWAGQVCRTLGWSWARVAYPDAGGSSIGIVSPNRAHAIFPYHFLKDVLEDGDRSNTTLLLFNMLCAGSLPNARPGTYAALS